jgi:hypothetical protein
VNSASAMRHEPSISIHPSTVLSHLACFLLPRFFQLKRTPPGVRVFVVHSDERLAYERTQRTKAMDRVRARLEKLERRAAKGRLKAIEKIGARAPFFAEWPASAASRCSR